MSHATRRPSLCNRRVSLFVLAWLIALAALWPGVGRAQASAYCPTLSAAVPWGGAATIDVTACDGPFDGGMSGPIAPFAQHGTVTIGPNDLPGQFVTYTHSGATGSTDTFALEDNDLGVVTISITIAPPATALGLAPAPATAPPSRAVRWARSGRACSAEARKWASSRVKASLRGASCPSSPAESKRPSAGSSEAGSTRRVGRGTGSARRCGSGAGCRAGGSPWTGSPADLRSAS